MGQTIIKRQEIAPAVMAMDTFFLYYNELLIYVALF